VELTVLVGKPAASTAAFARSFQGGSLGGKTPLGRAAVSLYLLAGAGICPVQDSCGGYGD
jgi:hypothetical protein